MARRSRARIQALWPILYYTIVDNTNEDITITNYSGDLSLDIDDGLVDLYDNCSNLNFEPFTFTDNKGYFITDRGAR